jgi:hypothetical protein
MVLKKGGDQQIISGPKQIQHTGSKKSPRMRQTEEMLKIITGRPITYFKNVQSESFEDGSLLIDDVGIPQNNKNFESITVELSDNVPGMYDLLMIHLTAKEFDYAIYRPEKKDAESKYFGVTIYLKIGSHIRPIGYYIPDADVFLAGNWTWHPHYVEVVIAAIWPDIIQKLYEIGYDASPKPNPNQ